MKTVRVRFLVIAGCTFMFAACSPRQADVVLTTAAVSPSSLLQRIDARGERIQSLEGSGTVTFESPEAAGSVFFHISLKKPDSLLLRFDGPFGIDAGFFFLSRKLFVMYNRFENTVTDGSPDERSIRGVIPFAMSSDEILNAFAGSFTVPTKGTAPLRYTVEEDRYYLEYRSPDDFRHYWIDPENDLITKYSVSDTTGRVLVEAIGERTTEQDGITVPRLITVTFPADKRRVSIFYSQIVLNPSALSFAYAVPSGARKTSLRD
jgi:outer membrane lipoprotein-sorting protein